MGSAMKDFALKSTFGWADILVALFGAYFLISYLTADVRDYIDVLEINAIGEVVEGDVITLSVIRDLHRDFSGFYSVTVRQRQGGSVVCTTGRQDVPYRYLDSDGNPTQLPDVITLEYWAWGGSCTDILQDGLPIGAYSIETCHGVYRIRWWLPFISRCWDDVPIFEITEDKA